MTPFQRSLAVAGALALAAGGASAHTGHDVGTMFAGLAHPLGLDHLLAMVAVGLWSVSALPAGRAWWGPAVFMLVLALSAALGAWGLSLPSLDAAIAASVVVFGAMLLPSARQLPPMLGLGVIALAASLHGLAHGAEAPLSGSFAGYAAGFLLTTAALHFGGVFAGLSMRRWSEGRASTVVSGLGCAFAGAGVYLLAQI